MIKGFVRYYIPINVVQDNADVIATKKQFAKRQAFAALNTELPDDAIYVIRTSADWKATPVTIDVIEELIPGDGIFTYRIDYIQWSNDQ